LTAIPIIETYRGVGLHNFQDEARLRIVRGEIDIVIEISDLADLVEWAKDSGHAPESRSLAGEKALAILSGFGQARQKRPHRDLTPEYIKAVIAGLNSDKWRSPWVYGTLLEPGPAPGKPSRAVKRETPLER
jgi:hypothetical protein